MWTSGSSVSATEDVIRIIAQKYAASEYDDVVAGIELLNEPLMSSLPAGKAGTQGYYQDGFNIVRETGQTPVIFHDGFATPSTWNGFLTGQGSAGAMVDHHEYQVFSNEDVALTPEEHAAAVQGRTESWGTGQDKFLFCGEWTAAMTDCAAALVGGRLSVLLSCLRRSCGNADPIAERLWNRRSLRWHLQQTERRWLLRYFILRGFMR